MARLWLIQRLGVLLFWLIVFSGLWPWLKEPFGSTFRSSAGLVLGRNRASELIEFESVQSSQGAFDQQILVVNRVRDPHHGLYLEFDSHGLGWTPLEFLAALILTTPIPWRRRVRAMLLGGAIVFVYEMSSLWIYIAAHRNEIGLASYSLAIQGIFTTLETTLVEQMGASFIFPFLVWVLVSIRLDDASRFFAQAFPDAAVERSKRPELAQ